MLNIKKLFTKILSYISITELLDSNIRYPTVTGWSPAYVSVPDLDSYNVVYVKYKVYGRYETCPFIRTSRQTTVLSMLFSDSYYNNGTWTYGRLLIQVDWINNRMGLSAINGDLDQMGIQGVYGTNKVV